MYFLQITSGIGEDKNGNALTINQIEQGLFTIRELLSKSFGGYTELDSVGGWFNNEGNLVQEKGKTWQVAIMDKMKLANAELIAKQVAKTLNQFSVFIVLDGKPRFIEQ